MGDAKPNAVAPPGGSWKLLSNHGHVLVCIARDPNQRLRDVANQVGITERSAFSIVRDLLDAGVIDRTRTGRRNRYVVHADVSPLHPTKPSPSVRRLLAAFGVDPDRTANDDISVTRDSGPGSLAR